MPHSRDNLISHGNRSNLTPKQTGKHDIFVYTAIPVKASDGRRVCQSKIEDTFKNEKKKILNVENAFHKSQKFKNNIKIFSNFCPQSDKFIKK